MLKSLLVFLGLIISFQCLGQYGIEAPTVILEFPSQYYEQGYINNNNYYNYSNEYSQPYVIGQEGSIIWQNGVCWKIKKNEWVMCKNQNQNKKGSKPEGNNNHSNNHDKDRFIDYEKHKHSQKNEINKYPQEIIIYQPPTYNGRNNHSNQVNKLPPQGYKSAPNFGNQIPSQTIIPGIPSKALP